MRQELTQEMKDYLAEGKDTENKRRFGEHLIFDKGHSLGGEHYITVFPNGYGASIVRFKGSYGFPRLFELAVLKGTNNDDAVLTYETPITDDVLGYLSIDEVAETLDKIKAL